MGPATSFSSTFLDVSGSLVDHTSTLEINLAPVKAQALGKEDRVLQMPGLPVPDPDLSQVLLGPCDPEGARSTMKTPALPPYSSLLPSSCQEWFSSCSHTPASSTLQCMLALTLQQADKQDLGVLKRILEVLSLVLLTHLEHYMNHQTQGHLLQRAS